MSAEEVGAGAAVEAPVAAPAKPTKAGGGGYYYWHGHEKQRAEVGDVAPKTSPLLVATSDVSPSTPATPGLRRVPINKHSWCNNTTSVSVYVDFAGVGALDASDVSVSFGKKSLSVAIKKDGVENCLELRLAHEVKPEASSFRTKPDSLVIKLAKEVETTSWFELVDTKSPPEEA